MKSLKIIDHFCSDLLHGYWETVGVANVMESGKTLIVADNILQTDSALQTGSQAEQAIADDWLT